jgi:GAF domain-containing protein/HAMP domain-containing protein
MRESIRTQLTTAFIGLAVLPLLIVVLVLGWQRYQAQQQQAMALQSQTAQRVAAEVANFIQRTDEILRVATEVQGFVEMPLDQQKNLLSTLLTQKDVFQELILLNSNGDEQIYLSRLRVIASSELKNRSQAEEFTGPQKSGETFYSPVRFDEALGEPLMTIAIPLLNPRTGLVEKVLVAETRVKRFWDLLGGIQMTTGEDVYIVGAQGDVIAHRNPSIVLRGTSFSVPQQDGVHIGLNATTVVLSSVPIVFGDQTLTIVAEKTLTEAISLAINAIVIIAAITVVTLIAASILGIVTVRRIVRPIETLANTAQAIASGDMSQQVIVTRRDEIGRLSEAFNSMTRQLQRTLADLERRVAERTREMEEKSRLLQASNEVSRAAVSILDVNQLTRQVVDLIRQRFDFYYVGLFMVDDRREWALLEAGTGEAGQAMLARGHHIEIGSGMIGWSIANAQPRVAMDVGEDAVRLRTSELPDTRSEAAIPLRSRGQVIGALTVQSTQPQAFDPSTLSVLQAMADQVAVAIDNARLYAESQAALEAERRAYGEISRQAWLDALQMRAIQGYRYDQKDVLPIAGDWQPEMIRAAQSGQVVQSSENGRFTLHVPIKVREQVIGVINLHKTEAGQGITAEEQTLLTTLTDQLAIALDSARLYQESQRRAERERLTGEITARMRASLDMNTVLNTAINEISQALGLVALDVRMVAEAENLNTDQTSLSESGL